MTSAKEYVIFIKIKFERVFVKKIINQTDISENVYSNIYETNVSSFAKKHALINSTFYNLKEIDILTQYYLYYYISIEKFVFETAFDNEYCTLKLQTLNIKFKPKEALSHFKRVINDSVSKESYEIELRQIASSHALDVFVENDKDLFNSQYYVKNKKEEIDNDTFFNEKMFFHFEKEYLNVYNYFDNLLNKLKNKID